MVGRRAALALAGLVTVALTTSCTMDLGGLGGDEAKAFDINEAGVVVGSAETTAGATHAFRRLPDATMVDLGTLTGGVGSSAYAVNESGQVAGTATTPSGDPARPHVHAVRWDADGSIHDLGVISAPAGVSSFAPGVSGIDEVGRIIGTRATLDGSRAFVFDPVVGHITELPGLSGGDDSFAFGMNDVGDVVGYQDVAPTGFVTAVRWDLDAGTVTDVSPIWGAGLLTDINDGGVMVGLVSDASIGPIDAGILRPGDTAPELLDIGSAPIPISINDHDVVVGYRGEDGAVTAFRWDAAVGVVDLSSNDPDDGTVARSINDRGQIVGVDGPAAVFLFADPESP